MRKLGRGNGRRLARWAAAVLAGGALLAAQGCGTVFHHREGSVWYECDTSEDYPDAHPCYGPVAERRAKAAAEAARASSATERTSWDHDRGGYDRDHGGHWVCPR